MFTQSLIGIILAAFLVLDLFLLDLESLCSGGSNIYLFILKYIIHAKQGMKTHLHSLGSNGKMNTSISHLPMLSQILLVPGKPSGCPSWITPLSLPLPSAPQ